MNDKHQLLERMRQAIKLRSLSRKTENAYLNHIRHFTEFCGKRDWAKIEAAEIFAFLKHLESDGKVAASTQNQALCALIFLYREVFGRESAPCFGQIARARLSSAKLPLVLTSEEVRMVLSHLSDAPLLAASLIYGAGLRLTEVLNLRVADLNFESGEIKVRDVRTGKKNRASILPQSVVADLRNHLGTVKFLHEDDCLRGHGAVRLPAALKRKYPDAERQWRWQYVFPSYKLKADESGAFRRHHLADSTVQKAISEAIKKARIVKKAGCQTLRYSFAIRLFERNTNIHTIHNLLGNKNFKTTMSYINFFGSNRLSVQSPLDY